jgi:membrane protein required for colicin V production
MNGLDWFLIAIGFFCLIRGIFRGAISQIFGVAGVIGGFLLAAHSYESVAKQLSAFFPGLPGTAGISFFVIFLLTWFCIGVTGYWIGKLLRRTGLGFLDRLFGGVVGAAKALILAMMVIALLTLLLSPKSSFLTNSYLTPYVHQVTQIMLKATPKNLQQLFEEKYKGFKHNLRERKEESTKVEPSKPKATKT